MYFNISNEEIKKISLENDFVQFLRTIMLCFVEGKHILIIEPSAIKTLLNLDIPEDVKDSVKKYFSVFSTYSSYNKLCSKLLNITHNSVSKIYERNKRIINVRYSDFLDSSSIQKTVMLVENLEDAEVYKTILTYYLKYNNISSLKVSADKRTGGGNTIKDAYEGIYSENVNYCLCILDRDKKDDKIQYWGDTAKRVVNFSRDQINKNFKCDYIILPVLEVENLIPLGFYDSLNVNENYKKSFSNLNLFELSFSKTRRYINFKADTKTDNDFWRGRSCFKESLKFIDNGNELLFKSYGGKVLSEFNKLDIDEKVKLISQDKGLERIWLRIGKYLADFFLSHELLRTA